MWELTVCVRDCLKTFSGTCNSIAVTRKPYVHHQFIYFLNLLYALLFGSRIIYLDD